MMPLTGISFVHDHYVEHVQRLIDGYVKRIIFIFVAINHVGTLLHTQGNQIPVIFGKNAFVY